MDGWMNRKRERGTADQWLTCSQRAEVCPDVSSADSLPCVLIRTLLIALACKLSSSLPVSCCGNEAALLWGMLHGEDSSAIWDVVELLSIFDMFKKHLVTQSGPSWRAQLPSPLPASSTGREKIYSGFSVSWLQSKLSECQVHVAAAEDLRLRKSYFLIFKLTESHELSCSLTDTQSRPVAVQVITATTLELHVYKCNTWHSTWTRGPHGAQDHSTTGT